MKISNVYHSEIFNKLNLENEMNPSKENNLKNGKLHGLKN